jgi:hypothetical protein
MILFEAKYHFKKVIFIGTIFLWNVFLFWVIWFTYSSDKMSTLDTIVKDYDKNIVLRDCQRQAFEYLHQKLSHDRSLHDHVFWDYFWDVYRDREPARTDNSVWEIANQAWLDYRHIGRLPKNSYLRTEGEKIRITKIWGLQLYIDDITLCRNDLSLHLYQLYIRLIIC